MNAEVTKVLNNFLAVQGYTEDEVCAIYKEDEDSYYDESRGLIVLGGMTNKEADKIFMKYCKELGLKVNISVETLSFLHELGHYNTMDFLDGEEILVSEWTKFMLNIKNETNDTLTTADYMKYFTCPIEKEATYDAILFCNHCPSAASKLDKALLKALYGNE